MFIKVAVSSALKCFPFSVFWQWARKFAAPIWGPVNKSETWSFSYAITFAAKECFALQRMRMRVFQSFHRAQSGPWDLRLTPFSSLHTGFSVSTVSLLSVPPLFLSSQFYYIDFFFPDVRLSSCPVQE